MPPPLSAQPKPTLAARPAARAGTARVSAAESLGMSAGAPHQPRPETICELQALGGWLDEVGHPLTLPDASPVVPRNADGCLERLSLTLGQSRLTSRTTSGDETGGRTENATARLAAGRSSPCRRVRRRCRFGDREATVRRTNAPRTASPCAQSSAATISVKRPWSRSKTTISVKSSSTHPHSWIASSPSCRSIRHSVAPAKIGRTLSSTIPY